MKLHAMRLKDGEDLYQGIDKFVRERNIRAGFILGGAAGLQTLHLRLPSTPEKQSVLQREGRHEVVSLAGTVAVDAMHIHISAADDNGQVVGGHLMKDGNAVWLTAEIGILEGDTMVFSREMDEATGWRELTIQENDR